MKLAEKVYVLERKVISDSRGWFLKPIDGGERGLFDGGQAEVYLTCGKGGQSKGGHYHRVAQEWFTLIAGSAVLSLHEVGSGEEMRLRLDARRPATVYIPRGVAHTVTNASPTEEFLLLAYTDRRYDPADTIPFPG